MSGSNLINGMNSQPTVSFAIACYNAQPYLEAAVRSALAQTDISLEVLIVDDGSSDDSLVEARSLAECDERIRVLQTPTNGGPAAARNVALEAMKGEWFAILDSDDLIDPQRSRKLINIADKVEADLIADNMLVFGENLQTLPFFDTAELDGDRWLDLDQYFSRSCLFGDSPPPGYLKPMIRRKVIDRIGLRYNETLRIGEDDELIIQALSANCQYYVIAEAMYRYRKHASSISHRLAMSDAQRMLEAEINIREKIGQDRAGSSAYRKRWRALQRGLAFVTSIEQLKQRRFGAALNTLVRRPDAIGLYHMPIRAAVERMVGSGR